MTLDMPLQEAMTTQRAIRRLKPDPVEDDVLLRCIEMALKAPTGSNAQNWEWIVIRDPKVKAQLARFYRQSWAVYGRLGKLATRGKPKMQRVVKAVQWQVDHLLEGPLLGIPRLRGGRAPFLPCGARSYHGSL